MELVAEVIGGDHVEKKNVLGLGVEARHAELHLREHLPKEENVCKHVI